MQRPRISIAKLIVLVAIVGVNFAYLRWYGTDGTLRGSRFIVLVLQVGLLCALFSRAAGRWFWGGFVGFGTVALLGWFYVAFWFAEPTDDYFRGAMNAVLQRFPLSGDSQINVSHASHRFLAEVLLTMDASTAHRLGRGHPGQSRLEGEISCSGGQCLTRRL